MKKTVPPVDPDRFEFLFTLSMESVHHDFEPFANEPPAMMQRIAACAAIINRCEARQMDAVRLAATFPLEASDPIEEGESFEPTAFLKQLGLS